MGNKRFVVFTGLWPKDAVTTQMPEPSPGDFVACADSGYEVCVSAGLCPDIAIGDFDSLPAEKISEIDARGIVRIVYPAEKDETDTLLCVKYGIEKGFDEFVVVGGIGGDFGHTMANLQALSFLTDKGCKAEIITDKERLVMADALLTIKGAPGGRFSVMSYSERSTGISIKNAKYELSDAVLTYSFPVGVSNEFLDSSPVTISVKSGRLLVIVQR